MKASECEFVCARASLRARGWKRSERSLYAFCSPFVSTLSLACAKARAILRDTPLASSRIALVSSFCQASSQPSDRWLIFAPVSDAIQWDETKSSAGRGRVALSLILFPHLQPLGSKRESSRRLAFPISSLLERKVQSHRSMRVPCIAYLVVSLSPFCHSPQCYFPYLLSSILAFHSKSSYHFHAIRIFLLQLSSSEREKYHWMRESDEMMAAEV